MRVLREALLRCILAAPVADWCGSSSGWSDVGVNGDRCRRSDLGGGSPRHGAGQDNRGHDPSATAADVLVAHLLERHDVPDGEVVEPATVGDLVEQLGEVPPGFTGRDPPPAHLGLGERLGRSSVPVGHRERLRATPGTDQSVRASSRRSRRWSRSCRSSASKRARRGEV